MIVLKVLVVIIVIEAVAIMALGTVRALRDLRRDFHSNGVDKMFENVEKGFTVDLSGLQPWDKENISTFHLDKPDGGFSDLQNYIKSKEAEKNDRETKADN